MSLNVKVGGQKSFVVLIHQPINHKHKYIDTKKPTMSNIATKERSKLWYLLPIIGIWLGGLIAYFAIRNDDPQKAKRCLIVGFALTGIGLVLNLALFGSPLVGF